MSSARNASANEGARRKTFTSYYVADGFLEDCNNFYKEYLKLGNLNFQEFSQLWKIQKMSLVFKGRSTSGEVLELTEELFHLTKTLYFCQSLGEFKKQLFALYLMYTLYYQQPYPKLLKYLMTKSDVNQMAAFKNYLKEERHIEGVYMISKMICDGAFHFCLSSRDYGAEISRRKYYEGVFGTISNPYSVQSSLIELLGEWDSDAMALKDANIQGTKDDIDFAIVHKTMSEYQNVKTKILGNNRTLNDGLNYVDHKVMEKLAESVKEIAFHKKSGENEETGDKRVRIKRKAFKLKNESRRHKFE